jgi:hypothetical protein
LRELLIAIGVLLLTASSAAAQSLSFTSPVNALYVNNTGNCDGTRPCYDRIQAALNAAKPGADVRIQYGTGTYSECDSLNTSGTASSPIRIETDNPRQPPTLLCASVNTYAQLEITASYVTVQHLLWNGSGHNVSHAAVWFNGNGVRWGSGRTGDRFLDNTVENWGASNTTTDSAGNYENMALLVGGPFGVPLGTPTISGLTVSGNTFTSNRLNDIAIVGAYNTIVENNTFNNLLGGNYDSGGTNCQAENIHIVDGTDMWPDNSDIKNNVFENMTNSSCPGGGKRGGIDTAVHADVGATEGTIEQNFLYNYTTGRASGGDAAGFDVEEECYNWTIKNNLIEGLTGAAFSAIFSHPWVGTAGHHTGRNYIYGNTIVNSSGGIQVRPNEGATPASDSMTGAVVKNNLLYNNGVQIISNPSNTANKGAFLLIIDYNLYWDKGAGKNVGNWDSYSTINFATWESNCHCDSHSLNTNPRLLNSSGGSAAANFKLQSNSPAIGAGVSLRTLPVDFNGVRRKKPPSIGAFEYPN